MTYTIEDLIKLQREASQRSSYPGVLVISKNSLTQYINSKIPENFGIALLNQALSIYCRRGYAVRIVMGSKKWNLDASKVPGFLDWFFEEYQVYKNHNSCFIRVLQDHYEASHTQGISDYSKKEVRVVRPIDLSKL